MISPAGKLRVCEWMLRFPSYVGSCQERSSSLSHSPKYRLMSYITANWEEAERAALRLLEGTKGNQIPLCHRLHQEVHPKALGTFPLQDLTISPWTPEHSMDPQPWAGSLNVLPMAVALSFGRCLVSTWKSWSKSAGQGEISNFSFISALGKARKKLSAPGWVHGKTDKKPYKIQA